MTHRKPEVDRRDSAFARITLIGAGMAAFVLLTIAMFFVYSGGDTEVFYTTLHSGGPFIASIVVALTGGGGVLAAGNGVMQWLLAKADRERAEAEAIRSSFFGPSSD